MDKNRSVNTEIEIDESKHIAERSIAQKLKNAAVAVVMGIILVQMYFFYGAVKSGSFVPTSVIIYWGSIYFIGYLAICGIIGWFAGQKFIDRLKAEVSHWKFW